MEIINSYGEKNIPSFIPITSKELDEKLNNPKFKIIVAEKDNKIVGAAFVSYGYRRIGLQRLSMSEPYDEEVIEDLLDMAEEVARELIKENEGKE